MSENKELLGECGVMYVATGKRYVDEAIQSVRSLQKKMPNIPTVLFTDKPDLVEEGIFTYKRILENPIYTQGDKITPMIDQPFEKTIFIDSDTYIAESFEDVFEILGKYDLAITHEAGRQKNHVPECPECFCEFNSGVIAFVRSKAITQVMTMWKKGYLEQLENTGNKSDQGVLRKVLYHSDINLFVLTPEYNYRTKFPGFVGRGIDAKILHGRDVDMPFFAQAVNKRDAKKVVIPSLLMPGNCEVIVPTRLLYRLVYMLSGLSCKMYTIKKQQTIRFKRRFLRLKSLFN